MVRYWEVASPLALRKSSHFFVCMAEWSIATIPKVVKIVGSNPTTDTYDK